MIRLDDMREVGEGVAEDALEDDLSTVVLQEIDDEARSEVLVAPFASGEFGETGRDETMQWVEREESGVVTEPSKESSGTMTASF